MKRITNSIVLKAENYVVVDLEKEYGKPNDKIRYAVITEYSEEYIRLNHKDELSCYCPYIVVGEYYYDIIREEYARERKEDYTQSTKLSTCEVKETVLFENYMNKLREMEVNEERQSVIRKAISTIRNEKTRERIYKYFWLEMSQSEIAEEEGVAQSAISQSITVGLRNIKKYLEENKKSFNSLIF